MRAPLLQGAEGVVAVGGSPDYRSDVQGAAAIGGGGGARVPVAGATFAGAGMGTEPGGLDAKLLPSAAGGSFDGAGLAAASRRVGSASSANDRGALRRRAVQPIMEKARPRI